MVHVVVERTRAQGVLHQLIAALAANATPEVIAEFNRLAGAR